jgi:phenylalanyl-tRNA synthetase beta chain
MPTIDLDYDEFQRMLGTGLERNSEKIDEALSFAKGELKQFDEKTGMMSVELKDTNRPDLWNVEGLVRCLRGFLGIEKGLKLYSVDKPVAKVFVDKRLKNIRPFIGCAIIKNVKLTDQMIRGIMQLQDKLDHTYGRNRRKTSIGLYNFELMKSPLTYTVAKPTEVSFVPLGFERKMNLKEILLEHPKGIEYGSIVSRHSLFPILFDSESRILSFPPIINSNDLGRVTEETRTILIEVTGTDHETVLNALNIVSLSLIDRGGKAYSCVVHYEEDGHVESTPRFDTTSVELKVEYANSILDLRLNVRKIGQMLAKAGYGVESFEKDRLAVQIPCFRTDIMHPVDLVEDVAIAYGYNNIKPFWREMPTKGCARPEVAFLNTARDLMVGLAFQEVLTYNLTNQENLFVKMNIKKQKLIELANPKVQTLTCLRNWLLPSLMEFLSSNMHVEYPQRVFELGPVTGLAEKSETRTKDCNTLAAAISHPNASFTEIKSVMDSLFMNLGRQWQIKEHKHSSFIGGRVGKVLIGKAEVGLLGEIHPQVLQNWGLENPVAAFELNFDRIIKTEP